MNLNELRDRAYKCACAHGFHDEELSNEHFLMLVITELAEAVEADRLGRHADKVGFETGISNAYHGVVRDDWFTYCYNRCIKGTVEEELSDAVIRLLDLAGLREISLEKAQYNIENGIDYAVAACRGMTFTELMYNIATIPARYTHVDTFQTIINDMTACIFGLAEYLGIDLFWHINQKMKYNEFRGYKHGKLY